MSIYSLSFVDNYNNTIEMKDFIGKNIILVNTASHCGFTPQYKELQEAHGDNVVVIGFPCNQFGNQEPGTDAEIQAFCSTNYGVTFPLSKKVEVNGPNAHPIFKYCKDSANNGNDIGWNFEKFFISANGDISHYNSSYPVSEILKVHGIM